MNLIGNVIESIAWLNENSLNRLVKENESINLVKKRNGAS